MPSFKYGLVVVWLLFVLGMYAPFIWNGGPVVDDWSIINAAQQHTGFKSVYASLFPQFSNRPLAPALFAVASMSFGKHVMPYIILNSLLWLSAVIAVAYVLKRFLGDIAASVFFAIAAIPSFSSTVVFSSAVMLMGSASVFFWALSLILLLGYLKKEQLVYSVLSALCLLISVLLYEASLPLFIINALVPLIKHGEVAARRARASPEVFDLEAQTRKAMARRARKSEYISYFLRYIVPILLVVLIVFIYQKLIIPGFFEDISRLRFRGWAIIPAAISKFLFVMLMDIPILLWRALLRLAWLSPLSLGSMAVMAVYLLARMPACQRRSVAMAGRRRGHSQSGNRSESGSSQLLKIIGMALAGVAVFYALAGTLPTIHGYDNRGLIGFQILAAGLVGCLSLYVRANTKILGYGIVIFVLLHAASFGIQRDNYIDAYKVQMNIYKDVAEKVSSAHLPADNFVLVNVPTYLTDNYNNEPVFSDELDAKVAIADGPSAPGIRLTKRRIDFNRAVIQDADVISDDFRGKIANAWYYLSRQDSTDSSLIKIKDAEHTRRIFDEIIGGNQPLALPFDGWFKAVEWYVRYINIPDITPYYMRYRARWAYN
ncbi:MAG: hypothetical protein AAB686_02060 [Patescibacteria group bacterium]